MKLMSDQIYWRVYSPPVHWSVNYLPIISKWLPLWNPCRWGQTLRQAHKHAAKTTLRHTVKVMLYKAECFEFLGDLTAGCSRWKHRGSGAVGYLLVVFPDIWMMHLESLLISRELKGRTLTATFTEAPAMVPLCVCWKHSFKSSDHWLHLQREK